MTWDIGDGTWDMGHGTSDIGNRTWVKDIGHRIVEIR